MHNPILNSILLLTRNERAYQLGQACAIPLVLIIVLIIYLRRKKKKKQQEAMREKTLDSNN